MLPALPNSQFSTLNSKFPCQEAIFTKAKTLLAKCSKAKSWKRQMSTKNYYVNDIFVICGMLKNPPLLINLLIMWKTLIKSACFSTQGRFIHKMAAKLFGEKVVFSSVA